jgi:prefoldin alpha subunit
MESQQFMQRLQQLHQQFDLLQHQLGELEQVKQGIEGLKNVEDEETLIPLGAGIFVKGKITDKKTLLMNVGAKVVIEKDFDSAQQKVEGQIEELQNIGGRMQEEMSQLQQMIQFMEMQELKKE